jgi:hypothetical protein
MKTARGDLGQEEAALLEEGNGNFYTVVCGLLEEQGQQLESKDFVGLTITSMEAKKIKLKHSSKRAIKIKIKRMPGNESKGKWGCDFLPLCG